MNRSVEPLQAADAGERFVKREKPRPFPYSSPRAALAPPPPTPLSPQPEQPNRPPESYEGPALARARSRARSVSPWPFVITTALNAMVVSILAVGITLGVVRQERSNVEPGEAMLSSAYVRPVVGIDSEPAPANAALQQISLRPIGSPDQPLLLEPQRPAPFSLQISPQEAANEPFILTLSGAPPGTILSGATQMSSEAWFLPPGSASLLEIALPEWSTAVFEIGIVLRRSNGSRAAQTKAWLAVPAPADHPPSRPKTDEADANDLLAQANRLLDKGDIIGARTIYQHAADLGSASAALALGATYDPNRLWTLGAIGLAGNKERARQWYMRASELGHPEAKARLGALGL